MRFLISVAPKHLIDDVDGNATDFDAWFPNTVKNASSAKRKKQRSKQHVQLLGQGQFGKVVLVQEKDDTRKACKILRKGLVFGGNVLYMPIKPQTLRGEVEILRTLQGASPYCLQLEAVYEGPRTIFVVTELCDGGDMVQWAANLTEQLRVEDVMRIARQLFTSVDSCDANHILHRDIKPKKVMFVHSGRSSDLRLIDFGSGCIDHGHIGKKRRNYEDRVKHQTSAGTAFYIAPEVFQRDYNGLADVWSAAVTLYVLVASYPANTLQKAFNLLQKSNRDLRTLPGHDDNEHSTKPNNMPDAYFDFLTQALTYWPECRPTARTLLQHAFVQQQRQLDKTDPDLATSQPLTLQLIDGTSSQRHVSSGTTEDDQHHEHKQDSRTTIAAWLETSMPNLCCATTLNSLLFCPLPVAWRLYNVRERVVNAMCQKQAAMARARQ